MLILLGDILYHGPRNSLPDNYNPKEVCALLNPLGDRIIACRGNCDSEVDQMVLSFPMLSDYSFLCDDGVRIFASHGHLYSPERESSLTDNSSGKEPVIQGSTIPPLAGSAIELFGHIHIQMLYKTNEGITVCNPGSISLPKNNSAPGFALYEKKHIALYNMNGSIEREADI